MKWILTLVLAGWLIISGYFLGVHYGKKAGEVKVMQHAVVFTQFDPSTAPEYEFIRKDYKWVQGRGWMLKNAK